MKKKNIEPKVDTYYLECRDNDRITYVWIEEATHFFLGVSTQAMREKFKPCENETIWVNTAHPWNDVNSKMIFRLFYTAAFETMYDVIFNDHGIPIYYWNLHHVIDMSYAPTKEFLEFAEENNYITQTKDGLLEFNHDIFKVPTEEDTDMGTYTALNRQRLCDLYHSTPHLNHPRVGFIYKLIPYINREWNVVCHNPDEKDRKAVQPMSCDEIGEVLGHPLIMIQDYWPVKLRDDYLYYDPEFIYGGSRKDDAIKLFTGKLH